MQRKPENSLMGWGMFNEPDPVYEECSSDPAAHIKTPKDHMTTRLTRGFNMDRWTMMFQPLLLHFLHLFHTLILCLSACFYPFSSCPLTLAVHIGFTGLVTLSAIKCDQSKCVETMTRLPELNLTSAIWANEKHITVRNVFQWVHEIWACCWKFFKFWQKYF